MTLQEVAEELARRLDAELQPEGEGERTIRGKGYDVVVSPFFGGWQATLHLPQEKPVAFFAEALEMLEIRIKAKLTGREHRF